MLVLIAIALALLVPILAQPWLREYDLRARAHAAALGRFFLDAMLGAAPIRAHAAQAAMVSEHEVMLSEWLAARRAFATVHVIVEVCIHAVVFAPLAAVVALRLSERPVDGSLLLLVYWSFALSQRATIAARALTTLPAARNAALRLAEPLANADLSPR